MRLFILILMVCCGLSVEGAGIFDSLKDLVGLGAPKETVEIPKGQENLPNYFRIEAQIVRLDNQGGLQADGSRCDRRDECDTLVYAYLDTEQWTKSFPGALDVKAIPKIFEAMDTNNPNIGITVSKDVCNKEPSKWKAVLRTHVMDKNKLLSNSLVDDFDCPIGGSMGANEKTAQWVDAKCVGKKQPKKITLWVRTRVYRVPPNDCSNARPLATSTPKGG